MGDVGAPVPSLAPEEDILVLVTGFGPFKTHPVNPSFLITAHLPQYLPSSSTTCGRRVRIIAHPVPLRVAYETVHNDMPPLIEAFRAVHGRAPHLIIHVGMAATRQYYAVETLAHRDGYVVSDVDGRPGIMFDKGLPEVLQPGMPEPTTASGEAVEGKKAEDKELRPTAPDGLFLQAWRRSLPADRLYDVRLSHDAGRYLCEYIYYTSLAACWEEQRPRGVIFLHVPGWTDKASVEMGADVLVGLVRAAVDCWGTGS
uniref:Putative pyroglutamyl peptidase type I n=1 Tax=Onygena corvina TaxID=180788 RepID=A0A0B4VKY7_9EURO|nr:putative pyroglutamyl peptidase type I [Onygena corvina]